MNENEEVQTSICPTAMTSALNTLPPYMIGGLQRYLDRGIPPGDFLTAVICNDLKEAVSRADEANAAALVAWVHWFYNYAPGGSWGSRVAMASWIARLRGEPSER